MTDFRAIAEKGRADLFFFAKAILGFDRLDEKLHRPWCEAICDFSHKRKLYLHPRDSYKSSVYTVAWPLWCIITDRQVIPGVRGCDLRILIANATDARARGFLREIEGHVLRNRLFIKCYGNLYSPRKWSETEKIISTRKVNRKEGTWSCAGKGAALVSAHYHICIGDDLVNDQDRDSATERRRTIQWWKDLVSLVDRSGIIIDVGTRWHYQDLHGWIQDELNPELESANQEPYQIRTESCYNEDGTARFAAIGLDNKKLERLKIERGSFDFSSQYENKPLPPGSEIFREADFTYYDPDDLPNDLDYTGFLDPSLGKTAKSDFSSICILGKSRSTNDVYLIDADVERRPPGVLRKAIVSKFNQFGAFARFGVESNGAFDLLVDGIEHDLKEAGHSFSITRVHHHSDKVARVQGCEGEIKAVRIPKDHRIRMREAFTQLIQFPHGHDDFPDSMEGALSLLRTGWTKAQILRAIQGNRGAQHRGIASSVVREDF